MTISARFRKTLELSLVPMMFTMGSVAQMGSQDQHPLLDKLAAKVVQKYQTSSCAQLKAQKLEKKAPSEQEEKVVAFLKSDPQMRTIFINKVAAPIANKMFECGMIP